MNVPEYQVQAHRLPHSLARINKCTEYQASVFMHASRACAKDVGGRGVCSVCMGQMRYLVMREIHGSKFAVLAIDGFVNASNALSAHTCLWMHALLSNLNHSPHRSYSRAINRHLSSSPRAPPPPHPLFPFSSPSAYPPHLQDSQTLSKTSCLPKRLPPLCVYDRGSPSTRRHAHFRTPDPTPIPTPIPIPIPRCQPQRPKDFEPLGLTDKDALNLHELLNEQWQCS